MASRSGDLLGASANVFSIPCRNLVMIDIHCHLLPGVDDGAVDLGESLAMCRMAAQDGCTAMVATPHLRHEQWWNPDRRRLEELWRHLRDAAGDDPEVFLGGEIAVNSQSLRELELLPEGDLLPLAGSRYLLLEFHPRGLGPDPEDLIHELVVEGWYPIIAHPERIPWLASDLGYLAALLGQGAVTQLTAMSVTGDMGRLLHDAATRMLDAGMVHFIASDAHDARIRHPGLAKAYRLISETRGEAIARQLFVVNPMSVLENRPLPPPAVTASAPRATSGPGAPAQPGGALHNGPSPGVKPPARLTRDPR